MARQLQSEALRCEWHRGKEGAEDGFALRMEVFTYEPVSYTHLVTAGGKSPIGR